MKYITLAAGGIGPDVWDKEIIVDGVDILDALKQAVGQAEELAGEIVSIEPFDESKGVLAITDAERLNDLEELFRHCPHAEIIYNDDLDADEPIGFTLRIQGCETAEYHGPVSLRGALDGNVRYMREWRAKQKK